jgi:hypothetical protein
MRQQDLRAGWRSEFMRHRFDAQVQARPDCIVMRGASCSKGILVGWHLQRNAPADRAA